MCTPARLSPRVTRSADTRTELNVFRCRSSQGGQRIDNWRRGAEKKNGFYRINRFDAPLDRFLMPGFFFFLVSPFRSAVRRLDAVQQGRRCGSCSKSRPSRTSATWWCCSCAPFATSPPSSSRWRAKRPKVAGPRVNLSITRSFCCLASASHRLAGDGRRRCFLPPFPRQRCSCLNADHRTHTARIRYYVYQNL